MTSTFFPCPQQILNEPSNKTSLSETMKIGISKQFSSPFFLQPFPKGSFILKNYCNSQSVLVSPIWCKKKFAQKFETINVPIQSELAKIMNSLKLYMLSLSCAKSPVSSFSVFFRQGKQPAKWVQSFFEGACINFMVQLCFTRNLQKISLR